MESRFIDLIERWNNNVKRTTTNITWLFIGSFFLSSLLSVLFLYPHPQNFYSPAEKQKRREFTSRENLSLMNTWNQNLRIRKKTLSSLLSFIYLNFIFFQIFSRCFLFCWLRTHHRYQNRSIRFFFSTFFQVFFSFIFQSIDRSVQWWWSLWLAKQPPNRKKNQKIFISSFFFSFEEFYNKIKIEKNFSSIDLVWKIPGWFG